MLIAAAEPDYGAPRVIKELESQLGLIEGQVAHLECRVVPTQVRVVLFFNRTLIVPVMTST